MEIQTESNVIEVLIMNKKESKLDQTKLKIILNYDKSTGIFTINSPYCHKQRIGQIVGTKRIFGYLGCQINNYNYLMHRLAWLYIYGVWPTHEIDHRNGIKTDNRISNLRDCNHNINTQNKTKPHSNNRSGYLGVSPNHSRNKWRVRIGVNNKYIHIGYYDSPESAYKAYLNAKRKYHEGCTI